MREMKFRGIRRDNKEFVYGDGIHFPKSINYKGRCYIDGMQEKANDWMEVMPETVGQFTGLIDRNGKEIYEGDWIRFDEFIINPETDYPYEERLEGLVYYDSSYAQYEVVVDKNRKDMLWILVENCCMMEVIGNIYENPELLEEK